MLRAPLLTAALCAASIAPAHAYTELTSSEFREGTGSACLAGGAVIGLTAFLAGPATITAAVGGTALLPATVTTGVSTLLGCGASAAAALVYYGTRWTYDLLFIDASYPMLYPLRDELASAPAH
jgi:hypothetical protein